MQLLDAVNLMLPKLGERPVTSLSVKHPTLSVLLPIVNDTLNDCLLKGWWFNKFTYTAYPADDGSITLGIDTLSFLPDPCYEGVLRGLKLYNPTTLSYTFTAPVPGTVTQTVAFDDLPESAASYVWNAALVDAFATDIGSDALLGIWQQKAGQSWNTMVAEHLRQSRSNTKQRKAWRRLVRAMNI